MPFEFGIEERGRVKSSKGWKNFLSRGNTASEDLYKKSMLEKLHLKPWYR